MCVSGYKFKKLGNKGVCRNCNVCVMCAKFVLFHCYVQHLQIQMTGALMTGALMTGALRLRFNVANMVIMFIIYLPKITLIV